MTWPIWAWVASLYALQNSMTFTPCWPRAVPTGGAGVAWPARSWSFTTARTFFLRLPAGIPRPRLDLGHLVEAQLDRGLPVEDVDHHSELGLVHVYVADRSVEVGERAGDDPDHVTLLELEAEGRFLGLLLLHRQDLLHLPTRQRGRLLPGAAGHEPGDPGGVPDDVPRVVVVDHLHQEVAREPLLLDDLLLPALDLHDVLHGDVDVEDLVLHLHGVDPGLQVRLHLVLVT